MFYFRIDELLDSESDSDSDSYPETWLPKEKPAMKPAVPFTSQKSAMEKMIDFAFYMVRLSPFEILSESVVMWKISVIKLNN